jgi:hypothetical protein
MSVAFFNFIISNYFIGGDPRLVFYDDADKEVKTITVDKMNGEEIGKVLVAHGFTKQAEARSDL